MTINISVDPKYNVIFLVKYDIQVLWKKDTANNQRSHEAFYSLIPRGTYYSSTLQ